MAYSITHEDLEALLFESGVLSRSWLLTAVLLPADEFPPAAQLTSLDESGEAYLVSGLSCAALQRVLRGASCGISPAVREGRFAQVTEEEADFILQHAIYGSARHR